MAGAGRARPYSGKPRRQAQGKPAEEGVIVKDWGGRLPVALVYPNRYYLGMSNLGVQTIYGLLNSYSNVVCERVFCEGGRPSSVESGRPLTDFAVLAFSISYELDYFNVVRVLRDSGIPPCAADRDSTHPLVIAGGPCITANPMPLAPFFDCLCIGEAEPMLPAMLPALSEGLGGDRGDLLKALSSLPGLYVPTHHDGRPVARQWASDLDAWPAASVVLTRNTELGDLFLMEVERGCPWSCRFCMVYAAFRPLRIRSVGTLLEQARRGLQYRKRIGLVGPAVCDHPNIVELLSRLRQMGAELSISSLRAGSLTDAVLEEMAAGNIRTIALAPEAGTQRLRDVIHKGVTAPEILEAAGLIAARGMEQLKLYFMVGLPSETDEDVEAIIDLTLAAKQVLERHHSATRITLNIAPFVPKAGTPFQWLGMASLPVIERRLALLKKKLAPQGIRPKCESPAWSQVQAVLARGDSMVAGALLATGKLSLAAWRRAARECRLDTDFFAHQQWPAGQRLPWAVIESGIKPEKLEAELDRAFIDARLPVQPGD